MQLSESLCPEGYPMESMTGFGRSESAGDDFSIAIEAKSVNHKNLTVTLKSPEVLSELETETRKTVQGLFQRGRIRLDVFLESCNEPGSLSISMDSARQYITAAELLAKENKFITGLSTGELLGLPGVARTAAASSLDRDELINVFRSCLSGALAELSESRRREGAELAPIFRKGFTDIQGMIAPVLASQKESVQERFERLKTRVAELLDNINLDEDRLMQELAVMAERSDVTEEIQRLDCHLHHALEIIEQAESPIGRKLEFLIQEMHRELNTTGAKVDDSEQSLKVIEMKNILAALKEQAANVE